MRSGYHRAMFAFRDDTRVAPAPVPDTMAPARPPRSLRRRRSWWSEIWRWGMTLFTFILLAAAATGVILVLAIYRQARTDTARPAQAIVVLGTAQYNGWPGPVFRARLDRALALWQEGYAPLIVVTGGKMPGDGYTEAEAAFAYLTQAGVPPASILAEYEARDTWESMQGVADILRPLGIDQVILVSDGFHLFRARLMAHDVGLQASGSPAATSPIRTGGEAEMAYVVREAAAVVAHLWQTRIAPVVSPGAASS